MEFFLVFLLGIALAVVVIYLLRPGLFSRSNQDFSLFEVMFEEALTKLEDRQKEFIAEIERREAELLSLQQKIMTTFLPVQSPSPKIGAVLELASQDLAAPEIAKKLGLGIGEVLLILELDQKK